MPEDIVLEDVLSEIREERERQVAKWGDQSHKPYPVWVTILGEEFGEAAKEVLEERHQELYDELIQTAAVAVAFAEALIKNGHAE